MRITNINKGVRGSRIIQERALRFEYMITQEAYLPYLNDAEVNNKPAFETKGIWEVMNFQMAGPFINYIVEDKENDRLMVVEGFTFAPSEDKRDFMQQLEWVLKTIQPLDLLKT